MKKYFQLLINLLVIFMFASWVVWPYVQSFSPYVDETVPDETTALDEEIAVVLEGMESNFEEVYANQVPLDNYNLVRLATSTLLSNADNYAESVKSVVYVTTEGTDGWIYYGSGSILTKDGVILTNYHVIEDSTKVVVTTFEGKHYPVTQVIASDENLDIAFLKIDADDLTPIPIGDSDSLRVGDTTLVIGHAESFLNTLSVGNVSGFRGYGSQEAGNNMQITNSISGGNSGGVVLNEYGELVGVPSWSVEYNDNVVQVQNLNFAVPINEALELLKI